MPRPHLFTNKTSSVRLRQIVFSRTFTIFVIFGISVIGVSLIKEIVRRVQVDHQIVALQAQVSDLQQQNGKIDTLVQYFNSSIFQEQQAREKLDLKKSGENVVLIPNQAVANTGSIQVVPITPAAILPNYKKWEQIFFN